VKIDPRSIGVGQYQHDVDQKQLRQALDDTVQICVNQVGVEVNTASRELLARVAGLNDTIAANLVQYRQENGPFDSRKAFLKVPRLGPKAFEQAAGFLRVCNGKNPLDASGIHPESYGIVEQMAKDQGGAPKDLVGSQDRVKKSIPGPISVIRPDCPRLPIFWRNSGCRAGIPENPFKVLHLIRPFQTSRIWSRA
jgi:uncharacterized protein